MSKLTIIAIGHTSRVGKDTAANFMVQWCNEAGYRAKRFAFASALKEACSELFRMPSESFFNVNSSDRSVPLEECGDRTATEVWCEFGEAMRAIQPTIWLDHCRCRIGEWQCRDVLLCNNPSRSGGVMVSDPHHVAIISDLRHINEWDYMRSNPHCHSVQVVRPDIAKVEAAIVDGQLDGCEFDSRILNDGDLMALKANSEATVRRILLLQQQGGGYYDNK